MVYLEYYKGFVKCPGGRIFMKKGKLFTALLLSVTLLTACGGAESTADTTTNSMATESGEYYEEDVYEETAMEQAVEEESGSGSGNANGVSTETSGTTPDSTQRKLIRTVDMDLETLEYDKTIAYIQDSVANLGGYMENLSLEGSSIYDREGLRYAEMTARIPKDKTDEFLQGMDENTTIRRKNESTEDITLNYVDTESHKKALQVEQERLMAILEQATTVEEIITLESRLSEVRYEIQNYESALRRYDNLVDYTTVNINVSEVERITEAPKETAWGRMTSGFAESFWNVCDGIKEFCIGLVVRIPYLVLYGVMIVVVVVVVKKIKKRKKDKKMAKEQEQK